MPIAFNCPNCGAQTTVADAFAGQSGPCRSCGSLVTVPKPGGYVGGGYGPPPPQPSKGRSAMLYIGLGVGGLLVVLCCCGSFAGFAWFGISGTMAGAQTNQCRNNMRQIGLGFQNFHDVYGKMPPLYSVDANGNPLHSWRVHILPFIEMDYLYRQIRLDEPWDSPHNRQFHDQMPFVYRCPSDGFDTNDTNYLAIVDPSAALRPEPENVSFASYIDGTSNTILFVEAADSGVNWMAPVDLDLQGNYAVSDTPGSGGLSSHHPGGVNVAIADGSIRHLTPETSPDTVKALITRNGREPVSLDY